MKFDIEKYSVKQPKKLPVILLLDVSGSMIGEKINTLNQAVKEMITSFKKENVEVDITLSIITFGEQCRIVNEFTSVSDFIWQDLRAGGNTPLGECLMIAKQMLEDKEKTPSNVYRPAVVLISDGYPTDNWEQSMNSFISEGRSSKCDRMAMAIGNEADKEMLSLFLKGTKNHLFEAAEATDIYKFFKYVTMSVTMRSKSVNPNEIIDVSYEEVNISGALEHKNSDDKKNNSSGWF